MDSIDGEFSEYFNADARGARRHKLKRLGRLKKAKNSRLAPRENYARALHKDNGATLDNLREAVTTLEDTERIARRVLGSAHPTTLRVEDSLRNSRAALRARETPSSDA